MNPAQMHAALDHSVEGVAVLDVATLTFSYVNAAAAALFGLAREELLAQGPRVLARLGGPSLECLERSCGEWIAQSPQPFVTTHPYQLADGTRPWIETSGRAVRIEGAWTVVANLRDVTRTQAIERRLHLLTAAVDHAADAIIVIDPVTFGYVHLNEAAARVYGLPRQWMLEHGVLGTVKVLQVMSREDVVRMYRELIEHHPHPITGILHLHPPGGKPTVVESRRQAVNVDGQWLIVTIGRDVTAHHEAVSRMRQLSAAFNAGPEAMLVIDPQTMEYVEANEAAAALFGMTREEFLRAGLQRIFGMAGWSVDDTRQLYRELIEKESAGPSVVHIPTRMLPHPGRDPDLVLEATRRAVNVEGRWLIVSVMRDVTQRVRAAAELEQRAADLARSNRDLEQFAYVSSHDLSEPLRMVGSFTQLIERRYGHLFDEEGREYLGYVTDGAQRMKRLIDDLLHYSRVGRAGERPHPGSLDQALDDGLRNLAQAASESNAVIEREGPLGDIVCDRAAMAQVFQNLVGNALKFRGERAPVIRVGAQRESDEWIVCVADNGIGIAPEYFEKIFVIFQRLHSRERYDGTGIGLAICKKIVERHGGRIWVESAPGEGACFKFTLPVTDEPA